MRVHHGLPPSKNDFTQNESHGSQISQPTEAVLANRYREFDAASLMRRIREVERFCVSVDSPIIRADETASAGMGGRDCRIAALALLAGGTSRTVLFLHLLFSLVVVHLCRRFRGLPFARAFAFARSTKGVPLSRNLVSASVAGFRDGQFSRKSQIY